MIETHIYRLRYSEAELNRQKAVWGPICRYLQRYIRSDGVTLDLGAGFCHFINQIESRSKIAIDINAESLERFSGPGVRRVICSGSDLSFVPQSSVDTAF